MKSTVKAHGKKIIVEPVKVKKIGNIYLPEGSKQPNCGRVYSVGPDVKSELPLGGLVYYTAYSGTEIKNNEETYIVISDDDILCQVGHFKK